MKTRDVPVDEAVGLVLAYDLTGIIPGRSKGAVLRRGHIIREDDLGLLRRIGKSRLKVLELGPDEVHEDDAARRLATLLAGPGCAVSMPGEAWADVRAERDGLLRVDVTRLLLINLDGELLVATRHNRSEVKAGELAAKVKVLGLAVARDRLDKAAAIASAGPVLEVVPFRAVRAAVVVTGREVYEGRVRDAFGPLLTERLVAYGGSVARLVIVPDEPGPVAEAVRAALDQGVDLVVVTGGMSPDDCTPEGIRLAGAKVAFYGAPVSPGAMTLLAYAGEIPVVGVPAGLLARPRGFFDVLLPRLLAGERLGPRDAAVYGHGGLCLGCETCVYPACPFGKGG